MALYRATQKLLNRIMTGRVPSRAFVVAGPVDNATPGDAGVTGHIAGLDFVDLIDPVNRLFTMPAALAPVSDQTAAGPGGAQCTVRCEVQAHQISSVLKGQLFMNRYFELDLPTGTDVAFINKMVVDGWIASAGGLTNGSCPAALNVRMSTTPQREVGV